MRLRKCVMFLWIFIQVTQTIWTNYSDGSESSASLELARRFPQEALSTEQCPEGNNVSHCQPLFEVCAQIIFHVIWSKLMVRPISFWQCDLRFPILKFHINYFSKNSCQKQIEHRNIISANRPVVHLEVQPPGGLWVQFLNTPAK